jgi:hypothetical protein
VPIWYALPWARWTLNNLLVTFQGCAFNIGIEAILLKTLTYRS